MPLSDSSASSDPCTLALKYDFYSEETNPLPAKIMEHLIMYSPLIPLKIIF